MSDRQLINFLSKYAKPISDINGSGHQYRIVFPSPKITLRDTVRWIYRAFQDIGDCSFNEDEFFVDTPVVKFQYYFRAYGDAYQYDVSIVDVYGSVPYIVIILDKLDAEY